MQVWVCVICQSRSTGIGLHPNCGKPGCLLKIHKADFSIPAQQDPLYMDHVKKNLRFNGKFEIAEDDGIVDLDTIMRHKLGVSSIITEQIVGCTPGMS